MKKWKCSVCGYVHEGDEPPEKCPVCGADRSKFVEIVEAEVVEEVPREVKTVSREAAEATSQGPASGPVQATPVDPPEKDAPEVAKTAFQKFYVTITRLMVKYHAHPISVHIPNGVLPVAVLFLSLSMLFQVPGLETASFYNLIVVVLVMPKVLFSGYTDWKARLGGNLTRLIITKMICGGTVFGLGLFLVIWRWVDPMVAQAVSSNRGMYLFLHLVMLGAVVTAGFLGGKLIRFPGD
ncbi:MAG: DUF2231 domain-containing protein [Pseudomonadota bacterium]